MESGGQTLPHPVTLTPWLGMRGHLIHVSTNVTYIRPILNSATAVEPMGAGLCRALRSLAAKGQAACGVGVAQKRLNPSLWQEHSSMGPAVA